MSPQAYYMAQIVFVLAALLVVASAAGFDALGDSVSQGVTFGIAGVAMIVTSIFMIKKRSFKKAQ